MPRKLNRRTGVVANPCECELVSQLDSLSDQVLVSLAAQFVSTQHATEISNGGLEEGNRVVGLTLRKIDILGEVHSSGVVIGESHDVHSAQAIDNSSSPAIARIAGIIRNGENARDRYRIWFIMKHQLVRRNQHD